MTLKTLLGVLIIGCALSAQASEERAKPVEQAAPVSDKKQIVQAFEQSCRIQELSQCGCISESLVPMLSDSKVSLIVAQLKSGALNHKNLIARNQVLFNKAQGKCSGV